MPTAADKGLYLNINSTGWIFATVIFLMLIFIMAIVNAIFFIRIYNQSKDRDSGTGITGLTVTGSVVIGVISIILGIIAFGWSLYLISKIYKNKNEVGEWWTAKKTAARTFYNNNIRKAQQVQATTTMLQESGLSPADARARAEQICGAPGSGYMRDPSMMMGGGGNPFE
jgi:heme/copper-type cytochrome/quinol oxidase subunit 2